MTTVDQYLSAADHAMQQGQPPLALQLLVVALAAFPEHPDILSRLAIDAYQRGAIREAITYFERALAVEESPGNRCNLAMALCDVDQYASALQTIQALSDRQFDDPMIQFTAARAWRGTGNPGSALQAISRAVDAVPEDADFRLLRAQIFVEQDCWDSALTDIAAVPV
ncbi:MAG: Tetratricopeptide repeat, partial [Pseudomonadota bacterium]